MSEPPQLRERTLAAILSFLLPGLGQLFQGRQGLAMAFFSLVTLANLSPKTRWFIPLIMAGVSWEAFRRTDPLPPVGEKNRRIRPIAFLTTGWLGFLLTLSIASPTFLPSGIQGEINDEVDALVHEIHLCQKATGHYPARWEDCLKTDAQRALNRDPWGAAFLYTPSPDGFELRSPGPDGRPGTEDDRVFRRR